MILMWAKYPDIERLKSREVPIEQLPKEVI